MSLYGRTAHNLTQKKTNTLKTKQINVAKSFEICINVSSS